MSKYPRTKFPNIYRYEYPECAYLYSLGRNIAICELDELRQVASRFPEFAYKFAKDIDKCPTDITRSGIVGHPYYAYMYALEIDQSPTKETWEVVQSSNFRHAYLQDVLFSNVWKCLKEL